MSTTRRRALGPGAARVPRTAPTWSPAAVDTALHTVLEEFERTAEPWREAFEDLDEDVLAETAAEARVFGTDPAGAVDELVRALLGQLDQPLAAGDRQARTRAHRSRAGAAAAGAADASRTEDVRWRRFRQALLEAVARHHHGTLPAGPPDDRPW
ncbi:hypothetical protein AB0D10_43700 [Kitasatospora sp. NPDC048545]|uniref:hypothetical protein n=1 Tax=Kitasatospora sp. NPDC048545 TaxID=3157208 RepID=UPI0033ECAB55